MRFVDLVARLTGGRATRNLLCLDLINFQLDAVRIQEAAFGEAQL